MTEEKIKRTEFATFMNVTPSATASYELLGRGMETGEVDYGPETEESPDITMDTIPTDLVAYKPKMSLEGKAIVGNACFDYIDGLRRNRAVLDNAKTDIVNVWLYMPETTGSWPAEKQSVIIAIDKFGGDGGKTSNIGYTLYYAGDPIQGTFNPTTKAFTATP